MLDLTNTSYPVLRTAQHYGVSYEYALNIAETTKLLSNFSDAVADSLHFKTIHGKWLDKLKSNDRPLALEIYSVLHDELKRRNIIK